jgi:predicted DNA binding protein
MRRVRFSVTYPRRLRHPIHREITGETPITRGELLMWSPTRDATTLLWCDGNREATAAVVDAVDSVVSTSFVEDGGRTYAFVRQREYEFASSIVELVAQSRVIFLPPVTFLETGTVRFEAVGETASLGAFHDRLSELGDAAIDRVHEFERHRAPVDLTERQRQALEAADDVGYYEIPRTGSIDDVAAALDCASSTAGELLRKAEATVVSDYVSER